LPLPATTVDEVAGTPVAFGIATPVCSPRATPRRARAASRSTSGLVTLLAGSVIGSPVIPRSRRNPSGVSSGIAWWSRAMAPVTKGVAPEVPPNEVTVPPAAAARTVSDGANRSR
jgi:hypothetical protein